MSMKVKELIEELAGLPQDAEVLLSRDSEGNGFSPWCGDHSIGCIHKEDVGRYSIDEFYTDVLPEMVKAIVLWPMN